MNKTVTTTTEYDSQGRVAKTTVVEVGESSDAPAVEAEPSTIYFEYGGSVRVVQNPEILYGAWSSAGYNVLLGGVELSRDGVDTGEYRSYLVSKIRPV